MKAILNIIGILAVIIATLSIDKCVSSSPKPTAQYTNPLTDTVKHYRDLYKAEHARVLVDANTIAALGVTHKQAIDSLCRRLRIKAKQLQTIQNMAAHAKGHFITLTKPVYIRDTVTGEIKATGGRAFDWTDKYMTLHGYLNKETVTIDYDMALHFTTSTMWVRKHKFLGIRWGKKQYYLDATCDNPNVVITGLQGLKIN